MSATSVTSEIIKRKLKAKGAALVGIADISNINEIFGFTKVEFRNYSRAVSIAIRLSDEIINGIKSGPTNEYAKLYRHVNVKLDNLALELEQELIKNGHLALAIPASKRYDQEKLAAIFPHKTASILSGLGWIGKSALLISFEHGARIRLVTVLTNAEIVSDEPYTESQCGKCNSCVNACPANAITGEEWSFGVSRDTIFDAYKCGAHTAKMKKKVGETVCGICISVCPYGKTKARKKNKLPLD